MWGTWMSFFATICPRKSYAYTSNMLTSKLRVNNIAATSSQLRISLRRGRSAIAEWQLPQGVSAKTTQLSCAWLFNLDQLFHQNIKNIPVLWCVNWILDQLMFYIMLNWLTASKYKHINSSSNFCLHWLFSVYQSKCMSFWFKQPGDRTPLMILTKISIKGKYYWNYPFSVRSNVCTKLIVQSLCAQQYLNKTSNLGTRVSYYRCNNHLWLILMLFGDLLINKSLEGSGCRRIEKQELYENLFQNAHW